VSFGPSIVDDTVAITRTGAYELEYLDSLPYIENANPSIVIDSKNLWSRVDVKLRPGESYVIALIFVAPKDSEIRYILLEVYPYVALFSVLEQ